MWISYISGYYLVNLCPYFVQGGTCESSCENEARHAWGIPLCLNSAGAKCCIPSDHRKFFVLFFIYLNASRKFVTIKYASSLKTYSFKEIFRSIQETDLPNIPPLSDNLGKFPSFLSSEHHWDILLQFLPFRITWQ